MNIFHLLVISFLFFRSITAQSICNQEVLDRTFVTQCGLSLCEPLLEQGSDTIRFEDWPTNKDEVIHIVSSRSGLRFKVNTYRAMDTSANYYRESRPNTTVFVDPEVQYQRVLGFGSTLTDASCENIDDLPEKIRENLISDYFSTETGIGLNLIKVPIGSTKYSYSNYVLDEPDNNQVELSAYDIDSRIPIIKDALKVAGKFKNRFKIIASSASAPPQYKTNNQITQEGLLRRNKIDDYASYLNGFIAAYKTQELNIWSLILSESPVTVSKLKLANDSLEYNSMAMRPSDIIQLIDSINKVRSRYSEGDRYRLLLLGDNRAYIPVYADAVFSYPEVARRVAGIAYICTDGVSSYDNLAYITKRFPVKYLLASQASINTPVKLGNWQYAENYATEIIKNLEFGAVGWIDFNLALNLEGGPAISGRFKADAPIMTDSKKGIYYRNPMLYAIGHLSRYIKPGSVRVKINFHSSAHMFANQHIAFKTPDNYLVVVVLNNNIGPMPINIGIKTRTKVEVQMETKSFNTFIFRL